LKELEAVLSILEPRTFASSFRSDAPFHSDIWHKDWRLQHTQQHLSREIMLVLSGEVEQSIAGTLFKGSPGTVFLYDSMERHDNGFPPNAPDCDMLWLFFFPPDAIAFSMLELRNGRYICRFRHVISSAERFECLNASWDMAKAGSVPGFSRLNATLNLYFADVALAMNASGRISDSIEDIPSHSSIKEVMQLIHRNCGKGVDITSLAKFAGYSRSHFLRVFKEYAGCRVQECIDRERLARLGELMKNGLPAKVMAAELGFSSSAALAHWRKGRKG